MRHRYGGGVVAGVGSGGIRNDNGPDGDDDEAGVLGAHRRRPRHSNAGFTAVGEGSVAGAEDRVGECA